MTYEELMKDARARLEKAGVPNAAIDAWYMISRVSGMDGGAFYTCMEKGVPSNYLESFEKMISRREKREPLQLILGDTEFMGLLFKMDGDELIPRPDTEILVQEAMEYWHNSKNDRLKLLDLCTGSGCIAVSLAHYGKFASVKAGDISEAALENAKRNAELNKVNIDFRCGDLFDPFEGEKFDIITANPPYIKTGDIPGLMPEVKDYDPQIALDGGEDGLDFYRRIASSATAHLEKDGVIMLEIGFDQAKDVTGIFKDAGFDDIKVVKDYAGCDRVVIIK